MLIDLRALWGNINAEFWAGRLPTPTLAFGQPGPDHVHAFARYERGQGWLVKVSADVAAVPGMNPARYIRDVLIHESIHVAMGRSRLGWIGDGHGRGFRREARRIGRMLGLPAPGSVRALGVPDDREPYYDFRSWPMTVRPATYYRTAEIGAETWK